MVNVSISIMEMKKMKIKSKEVKDEIKLYLANDWDIAEETPEYVVMKKNMASVTGHVLVALFTVWWTFGLGNVVYWLASNKKKKIMK